MLDNKKLSARFATIEEVMSEEFGLFMSLIEQVSKFWDHRPCNIRHSSKPICTREYFDEVETRKYFVEPHIPDFAQFDRWKDKKVLEIGCGIGTDSINFVRAGADLTVIDISEKSLEICQKRFKTYGLKAHFYCGDAEKLSVFVPIETYDLIYSFGVIHHTPHPGIVFEEIKKYCKPETEIKIMLYSKFSWKVLWSILTYGKGTFWRADEIVRTYSEAQTGCPVTYCYTFRDIRRLMKDYKIIKIQKDHIFPYNIKKYINYQYEWVWYFRWIPRPLFCWLESHFGWHSLIFARPGEWVRGT